jgi:hypothetical protein
MSSPTPDLGAKDKTIFYGAQLNCLEGHSSVHNLFDLARHLNSAKHYREIRQRASASH